MATLTFQLTDAPASVEITDTDSRQTVLTAAIVLIEANEAPKLIDALRLALRLAAKPGRTHTLPGVTLRIDMTPFGLARAALSHIGREIDANTK